MCRTTMLLRISAVVIFLLFNEQLSNSADLAISLKKLQTKLADLGYDPGPIDGLWSDKTRAALKQYQARVHHPDPKGLPDLWSKQKLGLSIPSIGPTNDGINEIVAKEKVIVVLEMDTAKLNQGLNFVNSNFIIVDGIAYYLVITDSTEIKNTKNQIGGKAINIPTFRSKDKGPTIIYTEATYFIVGDILDRKEPQTNLSEDIMTKAQKHQLSGDDFSVMFKQMYLDDTLKAIAQKLPSHYSGYPIEILEVKLLHIVDPT